MINDERLKQGRGMEAHGAVTFRISYSRILIRNLVVGFIAITISGYTLLDLCRQYDVPDKFPLALGLYCLLAVVVSVADVVRQMLSIRGDVVTLSEAGICDRRKSEAFIPWKAIQTIDHKGPPFLKVAVLHIDPQVAAKLQKPRYWPFSFGGLFNRSRLGVSLEGLDKSDAEVQDAIDSHWSRHGNAELVTPA